MYFTGVGTAVPGQRYTQRECWETVREAPLFERLTPRSQAILRKVLLGANGIEARRLALDALPDAFEITPGVMAARFQRVAPPLGEEAARKALAESGVRPEELDGLVVATCTGYLCPGLSSYLGERLRLRSDAVLLDLVGLGCGAAIPALRTAFSLAMADGSGGTGNVLTVCVEVSSAAMYLDDDPGVLISACLFGDGAAAVVGSRRPRPEGRSRTVRWVRAESLHVPDAREKLRFEQRDGLLRNILAPEVPELAAGFARRVLEQAGLEPGDVGEWILHAGGREVLREIGAELGLSEPALRHAAAVLREHGNMSSPSCLFALRRALDEGGPGGIWWLASFGAGFSSHGAILQVE